MTSFGVSFASSKNGIPPTTNMFEWAQLNNDARQLSELGDFQGAEKMHKRSLDLRLRELGPDHITTTVAYNALGEVYLEMRRLDEAEEFLKRGERVRSISGVPFDTVVTHDYIGRVYEMRGDMSGARGYRLRGSIGTACSNDKCSSHTPFKLEQLSTCSVCKCFSYCSRPCQEQNWSRHKRYCKAI